MGLTVVLIYDQNEIIRKGLVKLLNESFPKMIIFDTGNEQDLLKICQATLVDLFLVQPNAMDFGNNERFREIANRTDAEVLYYGYKGITRLHRKLGDYRFFELAPNWETTLQAFRNCFTAPQMVA